MKNGWERKRLVDFTAAVSTGPFGSLLHKSDYVDDGVPLVNPINIVGDRIIADPAKLIDKATKQRLSSYVLQEGDVVVGRRGEIGRCAVIGPNEVGWVCGTGSFLIRPLPSVDSRFLAHLIRSDDYREKLEQAATGATMVNLSNTALGDLIIAVPPLPEQQRIVGILDEALEGIAKARASAERNIQNARALFESHLQSVFTQRGPGWVEKRLGEVATSISTGPFGTMLHKSDYVPDGIPLVNPMNILDSRIIPSNKMMVNDKTRKRLRSYVLKAGDVVIGRRGELGRCALVTEREEGWLCGTGSFFVRLSDCMDAKFFVALFGSQQFRSRLEGSAVGTTMSSLNHGILKDLRLPVPPIAVQRKEMAKADELLSETQRLESIYQRKLATLEALKKSLLHQAFTGQL
jgi:type I restriction enzyme S subunit